MAARDGRNTKKKIINAAWELFYEQGFDGTTVDEIVERSRTSKGSFYHYFKSKDELLSTLSVVFDEKYEELKETLAPDMNSFDKLMYLNRELFLMIENTIPLELLARLYATQLVRAAERNLMDQSRIYYRLIRKITIEGQKRGQIRSDVSVNELVKSYSMLERAILYDWCVCNGDYSLYQYACGVMPMFLCGFRA